MSGQAPAASVLQLSTFTKGQSITRPDKYSDFPVTVGLVAPPKDQPVRGPVDVVVTVDVSMSIDKERMEFHKAAAGLVVDSLISGDSLAVVPFDDMVSSHEEELVKMSDNGKDREEIRRSVKELRVTPGGGTNLASALKRAEKILTEQGTDDRAAFIVLLSDGGDREILKPKVWDRSNPNHPRHPVHTFGFAGHNPDTLRHVASKTRGTYTPIVADSATGGDLLRNFAAGLAGILTRATSQPFSANAVRVDLAAEHPGVLISRVESGDGEAIVSIGGDRRSGAVEVGGEVGAGEAREFVVYLDVPEGGDGDGDMDLVSVGGAYTQGWNGRRVELGRAVVSMVRPAPPPCPCDVEHWFRVKREGREKAMEEMAAELAATGDDGVECECGRWQFAAVLREAKS
uniref:VWFA domain-containing protein n=1 Tax=Leersia perrieri TaxID=77586 RepID=A0A0D9XR45_9ORYZ